MSTVEIRPRALAITGYAGLVALDQAVLDAIPAAVYVCAADGRIARFNRAAAELWGRSPRPGDTDERFCGAYRLFLPDGQPLPHAKTPMADALRDGLAAHDREVVIERPDGSRVTVLVSIEPLRDEFGRIQGAINCFLDITKRTRAENELRITESALRQREHQTRQILDALPAAIYTTDASGTIDFYNRAAAELAGRTPEVGKDKWCVSWRLYSAKGDPLPLDKCPMAVSLAEGTPVRGREIFAERPDGERIAVMPYPTPLRDSGGKLIGGLNMLVDVTDRKRAEEALAQRAKQQTALYEFTDRLYRAETRAQVLEAALDAIILALQCDRASVLLFDNYGVMRFVASRDLSETYRTAVEGHSPWAADTINPDPILMNDIATADVSDQLRATIVNEGIGALGFIPLVANGKLAGKFMAYYDTPHLFSGEDVDLALLIARQLGFALSRMQLEDMRRQAEHALRDSEQRLQLALEAGRMGAWEWEIEAGRVIWSPGLEELHGLAPGTFGGRIEDFERDIHPADLECVRAEIQKSLRQLSDYHVVYRAVRPDGETCWVEAFGRLQFDENGVTPKKLSGVCMDVTERKRAEEALRVSQERLRLALGASRTIAWSWDFPSGTIEMAGNAAWDPMLPSKAHEGDVWARVHPDDHAMVSAVIEHAKEQASDFTFDCRALLNGGSETIWMQVRGAVETDTNGTPVRAMGTAIDMTERKRAEQQRTLLINELNHRVKNTLATVQALSIQTMRSDNSAETQRLFQERLAALSRAHDLLTTQNWEGAHLRDVAERALAPFYTGQERIFVDGAQVRVTPKQALAISMALHELATNAAKYGALSNDHGRVRIAWSVVENDGVDELRLSWTESGGPPVSPPSRLGFGARLIGRNLAQDLGAPARIDYPPEGVLAQIRTLLEKHSGL
jgi:PAS domain S-box-containing protein